MVIPRRGRREGRGCDRGKARRSPRQTTPTSNLGPDNKTTVYRLLLLPLPMPHCPHHRPHRHRRRRDSRAVVVGCRAGCMWPRSMQSASLSAVPMQRRAGKPPITASTCILLSARSQWRLLTRWVSVPRTPLFPLLFPSLSLSLFGRGLLRLVRSNESTARPSLSIAPYAPARLHPPVGFRFQGWDECDPNVKPARCTMHACMGQSGMS